jgi:tetratricopeptide (TPR) repeat protein
MLAFAQRMGADLLLNAEVSLERHAYQVIAHLYESHGGTQLWRQTFTAERQGAFELQQQIVAAVRRRLQIAFSRPLRNPPDPAAYEAYLTGNYYWNKRDPESLQRALERYEMATHIQPDYAEAWAGVANTYQMLGSTSLTLAEATARAKDAARRALALDNQLAEAHMTAALLSHRFDWNWKVAIQEFQRAIDLEPQNARAHHWYAGTLSDLGYADAAIGEIETAHALDPLSFAVDTAAVMYLGAARRFDEAIAKGRRIIQVEPQYFRVSPFVALAYLGVHDLPHAMEAYERGYQLAPTDPYMQAHMAYACFLEGQTARASKIFDELLQRPVPPPPFYVAMVYCARNDRANALRWLQRGYEDRDPSMTMIKVHPAFDPVRGEPEYLALLKKMNL